MKRKRAGPSPGASDHQYEVRCFIGPFASYFDTESVTLVPVSRRGSTGHRQERAKTGNPSAENGKGTEMRVSRYGGEANLGV